MKKLLSLLSVFVLSVSLLSACGKDPAVTTTAVAPGTSASAAESSALTTQPQPAESTKAASAESTQAPLENTPAVPLESVPETLPAVPETTENEPETSPVQPPESMPETSPVIPETTAPEPETTVDHPQGGTGPATETTVPPAEPSTHAAVETETDSEGRLRVLFRYDENDRLIEKTVYRKDGKTDSVISFEYYDNGAKKSESCQDYDENGQAGQYRRIGYYADGKKLLDLTRSDQEYRYEYDEQGRETLRQTMSLDGSQLIRRLTHEYAGESSDDYIVTSDFLRDGLMEHQVTKFEGGQRREYSFSTEGEGFSTQILYDELGRCIKDSALREDGLLLSCNEYTYYGDSSEYSRYFYTRWFEEYEAYRETEYLYNEAGTAVELTWKGEDGICEHQKNNEQGCRILLERSYPNGSPELREEYSYFPDSDRYAETKRTEWYEDGSLNYEAVSTYYESGNEKTWYSVSGDGSETICEYLDGNLRTLYAEKKNGVVTYRDSREYHPDGGIARQTREHFTEDGQPDSLIEEYYQEDGALSSTRQVYESGSSYYAEFKNGQPVLIRHCYPDGTPSAYWYKGDDGISYQYEYYENGQTKVYFEQSDEIYLLYETYNENGVLIGRDVNTPDGFYDWREFSETSGIMFYQKLKDESGIYVRNFNEEGKITRENRYAPDAEGSYLGYTGWYYFEDGGVKKVRISVYDSSSNLVSETVEDDKD